MTIPGMGMAFSGLHLSPRGPSANATNNRPAQIATALELLVVEPSPQQYARISGDQNAPGKVESNSHFKPPSSRFTYCSSSSNLLARKTTLQTSDLQTCCFGYPKMPDLQIWVNLMAKSLLSSCHVAPGDKKFSIPGPKKGRTSEVNGTQTRSHRYSGEGIHNWP